MPYHYQRLLGFVCLLSVVVCNLHCGYRVASKTRVRADDQTLAVVPLKNETSTFEIEQILTRALSREFVSKSGYQVIDNPSQADFVLDGGISRVRVSPVTFGRASFASTFLVTLQARVRFINRSTGEVVYQNNSYVFREQYVINVQIENFFSELNPALDRISEDFASSVVTSIMEGF
jgi:hypothetical protein